MMHAQPASAGNLTILVRKPSPLLEAARHGALIRDDVNGHYWKARERFIPELRMRSWRDDFAQFVRDFMREKLGSRNYYKLVLGHDLHMSVWATLQARHFWREVKDPFTGEWGWLENIGLVSEGKVTTAFRDFEVASMVGASDPTLYNEFKHHEVGTGGTAELNSQTALQTTTGIARVAGTQTDSGGGVMTTVATVTADSTETWQEHGVFNASTSGTMLDRSLISPTVPVVNLDTVQFTYALTKNAEA